ncbi:septum formation initiator family protein [Streptomyces sp. A1-5]|nr:septum formation initiator family protein [Streptomyces sp. A1-5]
MTTAVTTSGRKKGRRDDVPADRFSTATRLKALGEQAAARVHRAKRRPRRNRLTGRAALLALVMCSLVVALAYPIRQYISQRSDIADQRRKAQDAAAALDRLRDEKARWQDPAYVRQQARRHLHYVMPDETGYIVQDGTGVRAAPKGAAAAQRPWYDKFWEDVDRADGAAHADTAHAPDTPAVTKR